MGSVAGADRLPESRKQPPPLQKQSGSERRASQREPGEQQTTTHSFQSRRAAPGPGPGTSPASHTYFPLIYLLLQRSSDVVILEECGVFKAWKGLECWGSSPRTADRRQRNAPLPVVPPLKPDASRLWRSHTNLAEPEVLQEPGTPPLQSPDWTGDSQHRTSNQFSWRCFPRRPTGPPLCCDQFRLVWRLLGCWSGTLTTGDRRPGAAGPWNRSGPP